MSGPIYDVQNHLLVVRNLHRKYRFNTEDKCKQYIFDFIWGLKLPEHMIDPCADTMYTILEHEELFAPDSPTLQNRNYLFNLQVIYTSPELFNKASEIFALLINRLRPHWSPPNGTATLPLVSVIPNAKELILATFNSFYKESVGDIPVFRYLHAALGANARDDAIGPDNSPEELARLIFKNTFLLDFFVEPVPLTIPRKLYTEHTVIFAPAGHGKTQLLQNLIYGFLQDADPPAMFIVDSQGDMLKKIRALDFKHRDRLVFLDPEVDPPPQLNFLDFKGSNQASTDELFGYLMSALSRDLTAKQKTAASYLLRLMRAIPGATIDTLRQVMEAKEKHPAISQLDARAQDFFKNQFYGTEMKGTREQVAGRLYTVLANDIFSAMFAAPKNSFNAFEAMHRKDIVLINTSQLKLGEASNVLGRYFIAQVLSAAYERATIDEEKRELALLIVDEAAQYFDDYTAKILEQSRKYGLGLIAATQYVEQMPESTKAAVAGNTTTKYAGPVSQKDARYLAPEMYTTPDFIRNMRKQDKSTDFAVFVRGITPQAVRLNVPIGTLENAPKYKAPATTPPTASPPPNWPATPTPMTASNDPEPKPSEDDPYKATKLT